MNDSNPDFRFTASAAAIEPLRRGEGRLERGDFAGAIADFSQVIAVEMRNDACAYAHLQRGLAYINLNEVNQAIRDWTQVVNMTSQQSFIVLAYSNRANAYSIIGNLDNAIDDLTKIVHLVPNPSEIYNIRSGWKNQKGDISGAISDLSHAINLNPTNYVYYLNRGVVFQQYLKDKNNALKDYNEAIRLEPRDADNYFYRGTLFFELQQVDAAFNDINKAIQLNPQDFMHFGSRGEMRVTINDFQGAIEDFERALYLNPSSITRFGSPLVFALTKRSFAFAENFQTQNALADAERAILIQPENALGYYARANANFHDDRRYLSPSNITPQAQQAIEDYSRVIAVNPNLADAYASRAMLYWKYGRLRHAFEDMKIALALVPHHQEFLMIMQTIVNIIANDGYTSVDLEGILFIGVDWDAFLQARLNGTADYDPNQGFAFPPKRIFTTIQPESISKVNQQSGNVDEQINILLDRGAKLKRAQDFEGAKQAYYAAIKLKADATLAYYGLAKICYLTRESRVAIANYLKTLHVSVCMTAQAAKQVDSNHPLQIFLMQLPSHVRMQMDGIHPFAKWLLIDSNTPRHLAHVIVDLNSKYPKSDRLIKYAAQYRKALAGQDEAKLNDQLENEYFAVGVQFAIDNLNWNQIEHINPHTLDQYDDIAKMKFSALKIFKQQ